MNAGAVVDPPAPVGAEVLDQLLRDHAVPVYRLALSVLGDPVLAEDVVQETMLKAWQGLAGFRGESSLRTWVLRIAHNVAVTYGRKRRDHPSDPTVMVDIVDHRASSDVEREVTGRLGVDALWSALNSLDELSRTVLVLREVEHLSYEEIAEMLSLPLPTVKTRLFRARRQLGTQLGGAS
ncbi:MAG: RNA polymerase sigma factor [Acidimicrobiia bacterium]